MYKSAFPVLLVSLGICECCLQSLYRISEDDYVIYGKKRKKILIQNIEQRKIDLKTKYKEKNDRYKKKNALKKKKIFLKQRKSIDRKAG